MEIARAPAPSDTISVAGSDAVSLIRTRFAARRLACKPNNGTTRDNHLSRVGGENIKQKQSCRVMYRCRIPPCSGISALWRHIKTIRSVMHRKSDRSCFGKATVPEPATRRRRSGLKPDRAFGMQLPHKRWGRLIVPGRVIRGGDAIVAYTSPSRRAMRSLPTLGAATDGVRAMRSLPAPVFRRACGAQ